MFLIIISLAVQTVVSGITFQNFTTAVILTSSILNATITSSKFINNTYGIYPSQTSSNFFLNVDNCTFINNTYFAITFPSSFSLSSSTFFFNGISGAVIIVENVLPTSYINDCYFYNNSHSAIKISSSSSIILNNCYFSYNTATKAGAGVYILSGSTVFINNSTFEYNFGDIGGVIYARDSHTYIFNSSFNFNTFEGLSPGSVEIYYGNANITECTFYNNTGEMGMGINLHHSQANVDKITCSKNYGRTGGGCFALTSSSLYLTNSSIFNNTVEYDGGAIRAIASTLVINSSIIIENKSVFGGALYVSQTNLIVDSCIFSGNSAKAIAGAIYVRQSSNDIHY